MGHTVVGEVSGAHPVDPREEPLELGAVVPQLDDLFNLGPAPVRHSHLPRHLKSKGGHGACAYRHVNTKRYTGSQRAHTDQPPNTNHLATPIPPPPTNTKATPHSS
jgi:hypothetical protein